MGQLVPSKVFLTRGKGQHKEKLISFEKALREAGIAPFNLVRVSSIYPPHGRFVSKEMGLRLLKSGQVLFVVLSENATDEPGRLISASIGVAVPKDPARYGYIAEHADFGKSEKATGLHAEYLAAEMLATKLGERLKEPDPSKPTNSFRVSNGLSLKTRSISQTATGKTGLWTTVLAAAVLVCEA